MRFVKVGAAALNQTPLDWKGNQARILTAMYAAADKGVKILCLPEMCITGYGCEDAFLSPYIHKAAFDALNQIILHMPKDIFVTLGLPVEYRDKVYNGVCLVSHMRVYGIVAKKYLAGDGVHYEPRWFKPWKPGEFADVHGRPFGDLYFDCDGIKIGFEICEDAWVPERPGTNSLRGADIILNPSASHFSFGKNKIRKQFILECSRASGSVYIYANLLGNESGRVIYDGDTVIASNGELINEGRRFAFTKHVLTTATVDLEANRAHRLANRNFEANIDKLECVGTELVPGGIGSEPEETTIERPIWEDDPKYHKEEEFTRAVALGLRDYWKKSHTNGFVVSLSGGADSAAVACLARYAYLFHTKEVKNDSSKRNPLICVYQSTKQSSDETRNAARALMIDLNALYYELDIDPIVSLYEKTVSDALSTVSAAGEMMNRVAFTWEEDDITLQNIQARARAPGVWMIANWMNALLLATSNRSEAAVGYTTMDGDTCGGLAPIAGVDKAFLLSWLRWMENIGPSGYDRVEGLKLVNQQKPTAELRPQSLNQTDEEDLMPYSVLDEIEKLAIRDKKPPVEIYKILAKKYPMKSVYAWVTKFFTLWARNQWKRERFAPSFHLDDENLDPKTWCRFPILSGGYDRELELLTETYKSDNVNVKEEDHAERTLAGD